MPDWLSTPAFYLSRAISACKICFVTLSLAFWVFWIQLFSDRQQHDLNLLHVYCCSVTQLLVGWSGTACCSCQLFIWQQANLCNASEIRKKTVCRNLIVLWLIHGMTWPILWLHINKTYYATVWCDSTGILLSYCYLWQHSTANTATGPILDWIPFNQKILLNVLSRIFLLKSLTSIMLRKKSCYQHLQ